jgi:hypothetical protein
MTNEPILLSSGDLLDGEDDEVTVEQQKKTTTTKRTTTKRQAIEQDHGRSGWRIVAQRCMVPKQTPI